MTSVTVISENCNSWNRKDFTNTTDYDLECSSCSAYDKFSYVQKYFIWRWEIDIPYNWQYGEWEKIKLYPTQEKYILPYSTKDELSKATIYRWLREFRQHPDTETVLMGKVRSDRGAVRALQDKQKDALKRWRYDNPYRTVEDLREELAFHAETTSDPLPSLATIARYLRSQGLAGKDLLKGLKPQLKVRLAFESDYPQQLWMADTKGPNIYVNDPAHPGQTVLAKPVVY